MTAINRHRLFWLSVLALFTASMSASLRAAVASSLKAEWIDPIAPIAAGVCTAHAGQGCALGTRLFVPQESKAELVERIAAAFGGGGSVFHLAFSILHWFSALRRRSHRPARCVRRPRASGCR